MEGKTHTHTACIVDALLYCTTYYGRFTFYPLRKESRWSKDHDKLPRSAVPPMNGSEEVAGDAKGSNESQ